PHLVCLSHRDRATMMSTVHQGLLCIALASGALVGGCLDGPLPDPWADGADLAPAPAPPSGPGVRSPAPQPAIAEGLDDVPYRLSITGLYASILDRRLSPGVIQYKPQYELWSDGAQKARYALFPAGQKIDTSSMNRWVFPVGTKFWKEFRRDGKL